MVKMSASLLKVHKDCYGSPCTVLLYSEHSWLLQCNQAVAKMGYVVCLREEKLHGSSALQRNNSTT